MKVEREAAYALLTRAAQGATMLTAAACIAWRFTAGEQGLFFVFLSLGALIQLSEFGLSYAVLQVASRLGGDDSQFVAFRNDARKFQFSTLFAAVLLVGAIGAAIFAGSAGNITWRGPWMAFVCAVALGQWLAFDVTLLEATGSASQAWHLRMLQELIGGAVFVVGLIAGLGLWALPAYWILRAGVAAVGLKRQPHQVAPDAPIHGLHWWRDVWPFQWRVGLSSATGFLIFQAVNPIVLVEQGPEAAGRLGLAFALMNLSLQVTTAWPLSQAARFSRLIHQKEIQELRHRFGHVLLGSAALALAMGSLVVLVQIVLTVAGLSVVARVPALIPLAALMAAGVGHHVTVCIAVLLRAEQREPLLWLTVFGGTFTILLTWLTARVGSNSEVALAHLACTLIGLALAMGHYRRFASRVFAEGRKAHPR